MRFDIAIIGKGPAGISAAINSSARNKSVIMFGEDSKKILSSPSISNYPGLGQLTGAELNEKFMLHLNNYKINFNNKTVIAVYTMGDYFAIQAQDESIEAKSVILSSGVNFKKSIENEEKFLGNGISYCATCDAPLYKKKTVTVIGYNEESYTEADFLSEICSNVFFVPVFKKAHEFKDNVTVIDDIPERFDSDSSTSMHADKLILKNTSLKSDGFFVIKDSLPLSSLVPGLEHDGPHVKVKKDMSTNIQGLFAAGDITGKPYQIAKAVGEGQVAALSAAQYILKNQK